MESLLAQFFNPLSHKFIVLGLLGPFPVSVEVWATICDPTICICNNTPPLKFAGITLYPKPEKKKNTSLP